MYSYLLTGIFAGIASSVLYISGSQGTSLSTLLYILAPLPLFITGLGWGAVSAAAGAISGAVVCGIIASLPGAAIFLGAVGVMPVVLCHYALQSRVADEDTSRPTDNQTRDWYPLGNLLLGISAFATILTSIFLLFIMPSGPELKAALETFLGDFLSQNGDLKKQLGDGDAATRLANMIVTALPATLAGYTFAATTANLWLASKIITASGRAIRPVFAFKALSYPTIAPVAMVLMLALTFVPGALHIIALAGASAIAVAFMLLGLVVIHTLIPQTPARPMILVLIYIALLVLFSYASQGLAIVGIAETIFGLRQRYSPNNKSGKSGAPPPDQNN